jgi:hypothetical protein
MQALELGVEPRNRIRQSRERLLDQSPAARRRPDPSPTARATSPRRLQGARRTCRRPGIDHDRARTRRTLLPRVPERALHNAAHGLVEVGVVVDNDGILAAHLAHDALDLRTAPGWVWPPLHDLQTNRPLPVKAIWATSGCATSAAPTSSPRPGRKCTPPPESPPRISGDEAHGPRRWTARRV